MDNNIATSNKRIAKNTLFLYFRTLITLLVSLYTSRVVLNALGFEDYGIYNVVGGFVAMFGVISGALSSSISRFITFELGYGNIDRLKKVFSTSVNIQLGLSIVVLILGEIIGLWFLNYKMNMPDERHNAAFWVLQFSLISFCINLISVPYNACIIAHEKMDAYAYVSILEALLRLLVCYLILMTSMDRLIFYSFLLVCNSIIIRLILTIYCHKQFYESKYHFIFERKLTKEMTSFAGWSFLTNGAYIFNTQGVNLLINLFFGVTVNAARGIAVQVDSAIMQLVSSFTTAMDPQITKSYAAGNKEAMFSLVCRGSKFSFYLLFLFALPVLAETEYILTIWLKNIPPHAVNFVRLAIVATMVNIIGKTGITACEATGNIRRYVLWITSVGCLAFPITWIVLELGAPSESTYLVFIVIYIAVEVVRLWLMKGLLGFPVAIFLKDVILRIIIVSSLSIILPIMVLILFEPSIFRVIGSVIVCFISSLTVLYYLGITSIERNFIRNTIKNEYLKRFKRKH